MTTKDEALRSALETLRRLYNYYCALDGQAVCKFAINRIEAALAEKPQEPTPPFGSKRKAAMAVYTPPFKYVRGYIYDSQNLMVADDDKVEGAVASRVRGCKALSRNGRSASR